MAAQPAALPIPDAIAAVRTQALAQPDVWHEQKTTRFAMHVGWLRSDTPAGTNDTLRVYRELLRPNAEDLSNVLRYLPEDVAVVRTEVQSLPPNIEGGMRVNYLLLHLRPKESRTEPDPVRLCTRCQDPRHAPPYVTDEQICLLCATQER